MTRLWLSATSLVIVVAALKTSLIVRFVLPSAHAEPAVVFGLFLALAAATAGVFYFCYCHLRHMLDAQRKARLEPGMSEPIAKETIVARTAPEWNLSQAEADVAIFVAKGFSNSEIAQMRGCAIATVKSQLGSIYRKSGLGSRYQLIAFVTDEVCAMAKGSETAPQPRLTRKILPLPGRAKSVA